MKKLNFKEALHIYNVGRYQRQRNLKYTLVNIKKFPFFVINNFKQTNSFQFFSKPIFDEQFD